MSEAVSILTIDARGAEQGSAAYIRAMNAAQKAADRVLDQQEKINQAQGRQMPLMINGAGSIERTAKAWNRLQASLDPVIAATKAIEQATLRADAAVRAGVTGQIEAARVVDLVRQKHAAALGTLNDNAAAMGKLQKSSGLASHELVNLGRQAQDVFVSLASGQAPLTVLIQQGTQIADVFISSKASLAGFFSQVTQAVLPIAPILIAASAAVAGLAAAFSVIGQRQELANSLMGIGRAAGLTGDQLNTLAKEAAEAGQVSISTSRDMAAEYVKTGKIAAPVIRDLIKVTKDYAATTQQDIPTATRELAQAFADPLKGIDTLNARLGTLGPSYQKMIRDALAQNDTLRATTILMQGLASSTTSAAESQGLLTQAWERYKRALSNTVEMAGSAVTNLISPAKELQLNGVLEQRVKIQKQISDAQAAGNNNAGLMKSWQNQEAFLAKEEERLRKQIDGEKQLAQAQQNRVKSAETQTKGQAVLDSYDKDLDTIKRLKDEVGALAKAKADAEKGFDKLFDEKVMPDDTRYTDVAKKVAEYEGRLNTATKQLQEFNDAQSRGGMAADIASENLRIQAKNVGDLDAKQRAALAAETKLNELRGSEFSERDRNTRAQEEATKVFLDSRRAEAEAAAAAKYGVQNLEAQTKAIKERGSAYGQAAEIQANAEKKARDTGGNAGKIAADDTAEALARVQKERAENNARLTEAASLEKTLMERVNQGKMSLADATRQIKVNSETQAQAQKMRALGVQDEKQIAAATRETAAAVSASLNAEQQRAAAGISDQQRQTIQSLEKEIALVGQSTEARRVEYEVLQAKQQLQQAGISLESEEGAAIIERAKRIGELNVRLSEQARLQQQLRQAQDFAADSLKSFVEELLTGTDGINGALKSLGKGFLSASLDALISGKGPLAGISGLAGTRDQQGGILGALIGTIPKAVEKGAEKGAEKGVVGGVVAANDNFSFAGLGINGKDLAGGLTAIAGLAGAYGSGMAAGSYGQAVGGGAVSGGMAGLALAGTGIGASLGGAAVLGPIGLIVGGALAYFGQKSARDAAKKQREEEAQENYRNAEPGIATLRSQLRGESQDTLEKRINDTFTEVKKGIDVAFFANKITEAKALGDDFGNYKWKAIGDFQIAFGGLISSLEDGLGPNSAFSQARESVKATGDSLKGFVSDAAYAFGAEAVQVDQAREAAKTHALSILDGSKSLSTVATRMEEIRGAGAALQELLVELGMSATDAAAAIQQDTIAALARLKDTFESDLTAKINDAQGFDYINDVVNLLKEVSGLKLDAGALGTDQSLVTDYFKAAAQGIIDSAQLTGDAFNRLVAAFPDLLGNVTEFTNGLKGAAREADIAARKLNAQDRLFSATNPTDTLEGQLAAYDRQALREREAEQKAGNEAMIELEAAQAAERYNIVRDWNQKELDAKKQAAEEALTYLQRFSRQIKEYTDGLRAGSDSPLSPPDRLAAAQAQYNAQLALAQGGDRDALSGITSYSSDLLDAAKAYYTSSTGFQTIFESVIAQLEALPDQVSDTQLIIDAIDGTTGAVDLMMTTLAGAFQTSAATGSASAIASALSGYFNKLDVNTDNALSYSEYLAGLGPLATKSEQASARSIFQSIDSNGDGMIDKSEAIRAATSTVGGNVNEATRVQLLALAEISGKTGSTATSTSWLPNIANSNAAIQSSTGTLASYAYANRMNLQAANLRTYSAGNSAAVTGYADGGWTGPGGKYQQAGIVHADEYVFDKAATNRLGVPFLDRMASDNWHMPVAAMPVTAGGGGWQSNAELLAEMRAMRRELEMLRGQNNAGHARTATATEGGAAHMREGIDGVKAEQRKASAEMRQSSNRPRHGKAA